MNLEYVPLLQIQRDLYMLPRGMERFQEYLKTMIDDETDDLRFPLTPMNPMAKDHVVPILDTLLSMDADSIAQQAIKEASGDISHVNGDFKLGFVLTDDQKGGWTNRYTMDFSHRFEGNALFKRGWLTVLLWTSETYNPEKLYSEVVTVIHRAAHILDYGWPKTLRQMLQQERRDRKWENHLAGYGDATDLPTQMACLYGDEVAESLGYSPLGLSKGLLETYFSC